jgi:adenosylmethionine-8-amino-7-oxononanoate aminotransferase
VGDRTGRLLRTSVLGLLGSVEVDIAEHPDPVALLNDVRHETYERGLIVRCAQADGVLTVVFYPTLVVDAEQVERGTGLLADALEAVLAAHAPSVRGGPVYHP